MSFHVYYDSTQYSNRRSNIKGSRPSNNAGKLKFPNELRGNTLSTIYSDSTYLSEVKNG